MVSNMTSEQSFQFVGLSSDKKPIGINCVPDDTYTQYNYVIGNGSLFLEQDTSKVFCLKLEPSDSINKFIATWLEL